MALPVDNRLKTKKEFDEVKEKGRLVNGPFFSALILEVEKDVASKFGFIVSGKVSKKAVVRNKLRRRLSEATKVLMPEISKGLKVVFLAKVALKDQKFESVLLSMRRIFGEYAEKK